MLTDNLKTYQLSLPIYMTKLQIIITLLITFLFAQNVLSQNKLSDNNVLLITTINQLEKNIVKANEKIIRYDNEILKCNKTISTSEKLLKIALEKGKTEAEKVAKDAILKSTNAKEKNITLLNSAKILKKQFEIVLKSVKDKLSNNSTDTHKINAVTLKFSGNISVQKSNGEQFKINDLQSSLLENGDIITTSDRSNIEMQFFEGRGNLFIGEKSKLKFNKQDSTDVLDVIEGKVKISVEKIEEFELKLKEEYEKYKKLYASKNFESYDDFLKYLKARVDKKMHIRTSCGGGAVRGTEFIVNHSDNTGTEIIVLEGTVEMNSKDGTKTIMVNAGEKGMINTKGVLKDPEQIDIDTLRKWWSDEE